VDQFLSAPGFDELTSEQKASICNGCGSKKAIVDFVPDGALGADFTPACDRHDYFYWLGGDKCKADRQFLYNLMVCCECEDKLLYIARCKIAFAYWEAVTLFGDSSFGCK
jgi:hypothetical protein